MSDWVGRSGLKVSRKRIFSLKYEEGYSDANIVAALTRNIPNFGPILKKSQAYDILRQFRRNCHWKTNCKPRRLCNPAHVDALRQIVDEEPQRYLDEIQTLLRQRHNIHMSISTICRTVHAPSEKGGLGYSLKVLETRAQQKNFERRLRFKREMATVDIRQCIFLDETHKRSNESRRRRGYGRRGPPVVTENFNNDLPFTLIGAFNLDGFAPESVWTTDKNVNSDDFFLWFKYWLMPLLGDYARGEPNSVVVLDNVKQHWDPRVLELVRESGAIIVYMSPYSPEFNPIEQGFNWIKRYLKRHNSDERFKVHGRYAAQACMVEACSQVGPTRARNFYKLCGYDVPINQDNQAIIAAVILEDDTE